MQITYVIDDDKIYHFGVKRMLNYTTTRTCSHFFYNGSEAIDFIKENIHNTAILPDIILLDINMPVMNGWQFLQEFSLLQPQLQKPVSIYMITSSVSNDDIVKAAGYPEISRYIAKPISIEQLQVIFDENSAE